MIRQCIFCFRKDAVDLPQFANRFERFLCGSDINAFGVCAYCDAWITEKVGEEFLSINKLKDRRKSLKKFWKEILRFRDAMPEELAQTFALSLLTREVYKRTTKRPSSKTLAPIWL